jgi:peptidase E
VLEKDIFYVGGGNTKCLIALWREWGLDAILREAWEMGKVLSGISAGMICWFEWGLTDSITGKLTALPGLGFLRGSATPHYDGESERRPAFQRLVRAGVIPAGVAADDGVALHFRDASVHAVVSSRPSVRAYRVERVGDGVEETALPTRYLG